MKIKSNDIVDIFTLDADNRETYKGFHIHGRLVFDTRATFAADLLKSMLSGNGKIDVPPSTLVSYAVRVVEEWFKSCNEMNWSIDVGEAKEYVGEPKSDVGFHAK